jgi:hypothetical protein
MKRLGVLLALALSFPALGLDGGCDACANASDLVRMDGGYFATDPTIECLGCQLVTAEAEADALKESPRPPDWKLPAAVSAVVGFLLGLFIAKR